MNRLMFFAARSLAAGLLVATVVASAHGAAPQTIQAVVGTGFTYNGMLTLSGAPANGTYYFRFTLYDAPAGGTQIGGTVNKAISVSGGLFTTQLNDSGEYGPSAFTGDVRYLEISVSGNAGMSYTTLAPRQPLTPTPYALSLRPGAVISGAEDGAGILNLTNRGTGSAAGVTVESAHYGLNVKSAGAGVNVLSALNGMQVFSSTYAGLVVGQSAGDGVEVGSATNGVSVTSVTGDGMVVGSATNGVHVNSATNAGLMVDSAPYGVDVFKATRDGVWVGSATNDGVQVYSATNGMVVDSVTGDGVYMGSSSNGVFVNSATHKGVYVGSAYDGVHVGSAANFGVHVITASFGMYVDGSRFWDAFFTDNIAALTCYCAIGVFAVNTSASMLQPGDVVALQGTRPGGKGMGQPPLMMEVGPATTGTPLVGVVAGRGELVTITNGPDGKQVMQLVPRDGAAKAGEYVQIVTYGQMLVKASARSSGIKMGDKLVVNSNGVARGLQTTMVNGIRIAESAPTIGMALESLANQDGLIWVLVNPQ